MSDYASSLPIRTESNGDAAIKVVDGTITSQYLNIDSNGRITNKNQDGAGNSLTSQTNGSQRALDVGVNVAGIQVDPRAIRTITTTDIITANIKDSAGSSFSSVNPLPVTVVDVVAGSTDVLDYKTAVAVAASATDTHTYTVTTGKNLALKQISASGTGKIKVEIKIAGTTKVVLFNSTASPNVFYKFFSPSSVGSAVAVSVVITNTDKQAQDVYSTIEGFEV